MVKIVLATNNEHKIREITAIMRGLPVTLLSKKDFKDFPEVEETGATLEENAILKAREIYKFAKLPSMADDSGLEVAALGDRPGVNSARYAGPGCTFQDNNEKLLGELEGIPDGKRNALFRCAIAICFDENDVQVVEGKISGVITTEIRGANGFGYDPVFYLPDYGKTFAQIPPEEKNKISHRGIAINKARELLINRYGFKPDAG